MTDLSRYNVLAVDDVPLNLLLIDKMLSHYGLRIRKASGGQQALDMVAQERPDLVLLDLMMPGVDGFEVLRRLREDPVTESVRIVILSALNSTEDIVRGYQLGANDFITKPIILERLINSVATQLQLSGR